MNAPRLVRYTYEDYFLVATDRGCRHEFFDGEIYGMAPGTPEHSALSFQVGVVLKGALGSCTALNSDARVFIAASGLITYPDMSFVCGRIEKSTLDRQAVVNPSVIVEVTSPSTDAYDRGEKLRNYQQLPSVQAVIFIASFGEPRVTVVQRVGDGWSSSEFLAGSQASLALHDATFAVDDVFSVLATL